MDMARILVLSDSHGSEEAVRAALGRHPGAAAVYFLGDGLREMRAAAEALGVTDGRYVCGNNDWSLPDAPLAGLDVMAGWRIFYTHGHRYNVKLGVDRMVYAAREREADLLLFGHTHRPLADYEEDPLTGRPLHILNPGSLRYTGTYGVVDFTPGAIVPRVVKLNGRACR